MKKINLPQKGEPDYLFRQKKLSTIKTLISYAVAVAIFSYCSVSPAPCKPQYSINDHVFKDACL